MLNFKKEYILENSFVKLIPLQLNDYEKLVWFSINEPELWKYSLFEANSEEKLKSYIDFAIKKRENLTEYPFIVFDKLKGQYAGSTRFYDIQNNNKTVQIGFTWYGKNFQGTKLNKNCKFLLLEFAFDTLGMERVEFRADLNNKRSIAAMKSIGCIEEGILRKNGLRADGKRRDSIVLSILKEEWKNKIKSELQKKCNK